MERIKWLRARLGDHSHEASLVPITDSLMLNFDPVLNLVVPCSKALFYSNGKALLMKEAELSTIEDPPPIMHTRVSKHQKNL